MPLPDQIVAAAPEDHALIMSPDDFTLTFHVGAHKTATSHLQRSLLMAADDLAGSGVRYYGPEHFRLPGRTISALFGLRSRHGPGRSKRSAPDQLELMRKGASRIVFSEENYIGTLANPKGEQITMRYPRAALKISRLAAAVAQPIDVCLCIRNPTAMINSAYSQQILGNKIIPLERFKQLTPLASVDWLDLVKRLRAAPGVNTLTVWTLEDYDAVFDDVCAVLVGPENKQHVRPVAETINPRLSVEAVSYVLARHAMGDDVDAAQIARQLFPVEEGYTRFDGFTPDEHAAADRVYAAQIAGIAQLDGVTLLTPPKV